MPFPQTVGPQPCALPPPPQVCGRVHVPQSRVPPQPSAIIPQFAPTAAHVVGEQPQTFGVPPPPQVCGRAHVPQSRVPPQPSAIIPQFAPSAAHVVGVQHVPNDFLLDLTHTPLQHLSLVRHL